MRNVEHDESATGDAPRCTWCGAPIPKTRRGRKGSRSFCARAHKKAFEAEAMRIGLKALDAVDGPAVKIQQQKIG